MIKWGCNPFKNPLNIRKTIPFTICSVRTLLKLYDLTYEMHLYMNRDYQQNIRFRAPNISFRLCIQFTGIEENFCTHTLCSLYTFIVNSPFILVKSFIEISSIKWIYCHSSIKLVFTGKKCHVFKTMLMMQHMTIQQQHTQEYIKLNSTTV